MSKTEKVGKIIDAMLEKDYFSQWMALERLEEREGYCQVSLVVRKEMLNGFGIVHGGILFSLADSAFAFASNSSGRHAVSIDSHISIYQSSQEGDQLIATAKALHTHHKLAHYRVEVKNQEAVLIASFNGTVYRKRNEWDI